MRGHQVRFATSGPPDRVVEAGFSATGESWLSGPALIFGNNETRAQRRQRIAEAAGRADDGAGRLVATFRPDLILYQPFLLEFHLLFWRHGARRAAVFSTKPLFLPDPRVPPYTTACIPRPGLAGRVAVAAHWVKAWADYSVFRVQCAWQTLATGVSRRSFLQRLAKISGYPLSRNLRVRPLDIDLSLADVPELVLHAAEFEFPRERSLPADVHYIGPCIDTRRLEDDDIPSSDRRPLIYCHLGTEALQHDDTKRNLYLALLRCAEQDRRFRWLFAVADPHVADLLTRRRSDATDRIAIAVFVPQLRALQQARMAVLHGGANSVKEAIFCGCPMLLLPQYADQPGIAARVVHHGLGLSLAPRNADSDRIMAAISMLHDAPHFRRNVATMRRHFAGYEGAAERIVESLAFETC